MKKLKLIIKPNNSDDLKTIASITDKEFLEIISHLENLKTKHSFHPVELQSIFEDFIKEKASILVRQLISIYKFFRDQEISKEDSLDALNESIEKLKDWSEEEVNNWKRASAHLSKLLSLDPVCRVAKTLELSKDYDSILERAQILVDIRPIFDDAYDSITGCLISQTLYITYENDFNSKKISILMGKDKIQSLLISCEKALTKITKAEKMIKDIGIQTLTIGDNSET